MTWAVAVNEQAQSAPSSNNPRTGLIFMGIRGSEGRPFRTGTLQSVTVWKGRNGVRDDLPISARRQSAFRDFPRPV
jgi:hypothetical protein